MYVFRCYLYVIYASKVFFLQSIKHDIYFHQVYLLNHYDKHLSVVIIILLKYSILILY